jgi:hypothetical protein
VSRAHFQKAASAHSLLRQGLALAHEELLPQAWNFCRRRREYPLHNAVIGNAVIVLRCA